MPIWLGLNFQESLSPFMESVSFFHDFSIVILIYISLLSGYFIFSSTVCGFFNSFNKDNHELETIWTFLPTVILITLAIPSMKVLYFTEQLEEFNFSFKSLGHQWYWSYDSSFQDDEVDCFMENSNVSRLLKSSNILNLPTGVNLRSVVTSSDVIHSWSVPSLGVKIDAVPGRLNQTFLMSFYSSLVVGQCSEICGANHSFMPIVILFK